ANGGGWCVLTRHAVLLHRERWLCYRHPQQRHQLGLPLRAIDRCSTEKETMDKNDQMRIGMREATRLTRAGRLLEATAIIQRTLRGLAPDRGGDATGQPADEAIEGTFRVIDPTPRPTE